ncbi:unnamed protein product [Rhizoctonia solani]|uniref:Uncharacterized protein n=1 Tax=Rhizoctonia solani TaxID=456999 RepID=A0A8H2WWB2_9AGAM|nr:unnamed protein product [Rhizoctonia solani]
MSKSKDKIPRASNKMTTAEVDYLKNNWYEARLSLQNPRSIIEVDGEKMTRLEEFLSRCIDAFAKTFPYRHPDTNPSDISESLRHLQYDRNEWPAVFRERESVVSQSHPWKINESEQEGSESQEDNNESKEEKDATTEDEVESEDWDDSTQEPAEIESLAEDHGEDETNEAETVPPLQSGTVTGAATVSGALEDIHFRPFNATYDAWERAFNKLSGLADKSWAECNAEELESRQMDVPDIVQQMLDMLHFCTGYEVYATGTVLSKEQGYKFQTATPRSQHFCDLPQGSETRDYFNEYDQIFARTLRVKVTHEQQQRLLADYLAYKMEKPGKVVACMYLTIYWLSSMKKATKI